MSISDIFHAKYRSTLRLSWAVVDSAWIFKVFGFAFSVDYLLALTFKFNRGDQSFVCPGTTFLSTLPITVNLVSHSQIFDVSALDPVHLE